MDSKPFRLLPPELMPSIPGVRMPREFYWVLSEPAPLAGMAYPGPAIPWADIAAAGFQHVVCLASDAPGYDPSPLSSLFSAELEDLFHAGPPQAPDREERLLRAALEAVLAPLHTGQGVVVHCAGGTGRTGTLIGCVLRSLGFPASHVLAYLNDLNQARGRPGWPESRWQARFVESFQ